MAEGGGLGLGVSFFLPSLFSALGLETGGTGRPSPFQGSRPPPPDARSGLGPEDILTPEFIQAGLDLAERLADAREEVSRLTQPTDPPRNEPERRPPPSPDVGRILDDLCRLFGVGCGDDDGRGGGFPRTPGLPRDPRREVPRGDPTAEGPTMAEGDLTRRLCDALQADPMGLGLPATAAELALLNALGCNAPGQVGQVRQADISPTSTSACGSQPFRMEAVRRRSHPCCCGPAPVCTCC